MVRFNALLVPVLCALPMGGAMADVTSPSGKTVECYCTDRTGARVELGQTICLQVDGRMFMAQCQMSLNSPMWREMSQGCVSSSLGQSSQPAVNASLIDS